MASLLALLILARTLEFEAVEVDWIAATRTVTDLDQILPRREAGLVRLLGNPDYLVRELAAQELRAMGPAASVALAWGMHARDPEIAHRSASLRDGLAACPECAHREEMDRWCAACQGSLDIRCGMEWARVGGEWTYVIGPRNLFGREGKAVLWP